MANENEKSIITTEKEVKEIKVVDSRSIAISEVTKQTKSLFGDENYKKELTYCLNILLNNDYLFNQFKSNPDSLRNAMINLASSGLTLNPTFKYCYLVPRKNEVNLMISYKGMIKLLIDNGTLKDVYAHEVYDCDLFDVSFGTSDYLVHKPNFQKRMLKDSKIVFYYAVATLHNNIKKYEVMTISEINKIKGLATTKNVWEQWNEEMSKKTVIKRLLKNITVSEYIMELINNDNPIDFKNLNEKSEQKTEVEDFIE